MPIFPVVHSIPQKASFRSSRMINAVTRLCEMPFHAVHSLKGLCHLYGICAEMWGNGHAFIYVTHC